MPSSAPAPAVSDRRIGLAWAATTVGVAALVVGVVLAYAFRGEAIGHRAWAVGLVAAGLAATLLAVALYVTAETRPRGLALPAGRERLPAPSWWGPVALAGSCALVAGLWADTFLAGFGLAVGLAALAVGLREFARTLSARAAARAGAASADGALDRATVRLARQLQAFAAQHGGAVEAHVQYVGRYGAKIVVVGADGRFGDAMADDVPRARAACQLAGVAVRDGWAPDVRTKMRSTRYEWARMAGQQLPRRDASRAGAAPTSGSAAQAGSVRSPG